MRIFKEFLSNHYTLTNDLTDMIPGKEMYKDYLDWCEDQEIEHILTRKSFSLKMEELGIIKKRYSDGYRYLGIKEKDEDEESTFLYDDDEEDDIEEYTKEGDTQDFSFNLSIKNGAVQINIEVK